MSSHVQEQSQKGIDQKPITRRGALALAGATALAFATPLTVANPSTALAAASFIDVPSSHWVVTEGWLDYAVSHGLMSGYKNASGQLTGYFGPEHPISRGQVAAVLFRIANPGNDATSNPSHYAPSTGFKDNGGEPYYRAAVKWLKDKGIATGDRDAVGNNLNTFRPDDPITRQELAAMAYRFAQKTGVDLGSIDAAVLGAYYDGAAVQPYARESIAWCSMAGVISGGSGDAHGRIAPGERATRAQAAKILSVLHQHYQKKNSDLSFQLIKGSYQFSSGAGGWQTVLNLKADGTFDGVYSDYDLGDRGSQYPNGSASISEFTGVFHADELRRIDAYSYSMPMQAYRVTSLVGAVEYQNGYRYKYVEPYGLEGTDFDFKLYVPGTPSSAMSDDLNSWTRFHKHNDRLTEYTFTDKRILPFIRM